jgi:hypothetical protein
MGNNKGGPIILYEGDSLLKVIKNAVKKKLKNKTKNKKVIMNEPYEMKDNETIYKEVNGKMVPVSIDELEDDVFSYTSYDEYELSAIEFTLYNSFLGRCTKNEILGFKVLYNATTKTGMHCLSFNRNFSEFENNMFILKHKDYNGTFLLHCYCFTDDQNRVCYHVSISTDFDIKYDTLETFKDILKRAAFNESIYKGKVINVTIQNGIYHGITINDTSEFCSTLELTETQKRFSQHFINIVSKGGNLRMLFSGEPGSGKTELMRNMMYALLGKSTFIIPIFNTSSDLTSILNSCEIFLPGTIVIDDIDVYLGSRDNHSNTSLLGDFLSFFDGIKKRKIGLLASTNSKELVDKAAERPGRFNLTLDFSYLVDEQIDAVVNLHLPEDYRIKEVYEALKGNDKKGNKIKVTGAFIYNLGLNIKEMSEDNELWTLKDTLLLIDELYAGFYSSQISAGKKKMGYI